MSPRWMLLALFLVTACSKDKQEAPAAVSGRVAISVTEKGFEPTLIRVTKGQPITLVMTRKTDETCATEVTIPEYKIDQKLPLNQPVEITFTPDKVGELEYGCAMDHMIRGVLQVR